MPDASTSNADAPRLLERRWVRLAAGFGILGLCVLQTVAVLKMPFVTIRTATRVFPVYGPEQSQNLHLVLAATGIVGGLLALYYALSSAKLRAAFFAVGGVGAGFTILLIAGAWQTVSEGAIRDPLVYAQVKTSELVMAIGSGLWASLAAALGILLLAVLVFLGNRPPAEDEDSLLSRRRV